MGTRSTIALELADGTVEQVYCHWDGYLSNNGRILQEHYSNPFILRDLIDLGDLSSLKPEIGEAHPFGYHGTEISAEDYEKQFGEMCTFYGRDRGEAGTSAKKFVDYENYVRCHQREEYEYILRTDGKWYVSYFKTGELYVELETAAYVNNMMEAA
jgi:hypothetical protein